MSKTVEKLWKNLWDNLWETVWKMLWKSEASGVLHIKIVCDGGFTRSFGKICRWISTWFLDYLTDRNGEICTFST